MFAYVVCTKETERIYAMYYVETKLVFRVEHEENVSQIWWVREAIEDWLEGEEEVVYVKVEKVVNEGEKQ